MVPTAATDAPERGRRDGAGSSQPLEPSTVDAPLTPAQIVAAQHDAFLSSPNLDPAWIAGWHAAINHAVHVLNKHGHSDD